MTTVRKGIFVPFIFTLALALLVAPVVAGSTSVAIGGEILPQGDQTVNVSFEVSGCNVTTGDDGKSHVRIDTSEAQARVAGTTITIPQETYTLTIETDEVPAKDEGGTITGTVAKIR
ncbi:MAG: hypothetical protein WC112_08745, partial [Proteiniphilum sp.]